MSRADDAGDFERWLDRELGRAVDAELGPDAQAPRLVARSRWSGRRGLAGLGIWGAVAVFAVALAAAGGGAALATGSPNPVSWGHEVVQAVSVGSLARERRPVPASDAPHDRSGEPPAAAVTPGQHAAHGPGPGQSNGNAGKPKQQGHGQGSPPPDQGRPPRTQDSSSGSPPGENDSP